MNPFFSKPQNPKPVQNLKPAARPTTRPTSKPAARPTPKPAQKPTIKPLKMAAERQASSNELCIMFSDVPNTLLARDIKDIGFDSTVDTRSFVAYCTQTLKQKLAAVLTRHSYIELVDFDPRVPATFQAPNDPPHIVRPTPELVSQGLIPQSISQLATFDTRDPLPADPLPADPLPADPLPADPATVTPEAKQPTQDPPSYNHDYETYKKQCKELCAFYGLDCADLALLAVDKLYTSLNN